MLTPTIKVTKDLTSLRAMEKSVKALNKRHIKMGWYEGRNYPASHENSGISIAQVASWQEYGATNDGRRIPSRPYFRQALNMSKRRYKKDLASIFGTAIKGKNTSTRLESLADSFVNDYKESVLRQNYTKLSEYTVAVKKHTYQMSHTGIMMDSFKSKVFRTSQNNIKD